MSDLLDLDKTLRGVTKNIVNVAHGLKQSQFLLFTKCIRTELQQIAPVLVYESSVPIYIGHTV